MPAGAEGVAAARGTLASIAAAYDVVFERSFSTMSRMRLRSPISGMAKNSASAWARPRGRHLDPGPSVGCVRDAREVSTPDP
jgi:hypothetical protein